MEKLANLPANGCEFRTLLVVIRKTYGYQKKADIISLSQFVRSTGLKRANVCRTIKSLVAKRLLYKEENLYKINKNWEEWVVAKRLPSSQNEGGVVAKRLPKVVAKRLHTKERKKQNTKETDISPAAIPVSFPQKDYELVIAEYMRLKGVSLKGKEFLPVKKHIKLIFESERTKEDIIRCMKWFAEAADSGERLLKWTEQWNMNTIRIKLPEFLAGKLDY